MNPILLYPNTEAQFKLFNDAAKANGVKMACISPEVLEEIEDALFFERMVAAKTGILVPEEKVKALFRKKTTGK